MDGDCVVICHLQYEISSVSVTDLGCGSGGELFLWCHVPAGCGRAIQIDSRGGEQTDGGETTTTGGGAVSWRDVASLSCAGSPACVRQRCVRGAEAVGPRSAAGRVLGSELMGRAGAEVPGRDAGDLGAAAVERRVELAAPCSRRWRVQGEAAPVLYTRISVRVSETAAPASRRREDSSAHQESGCEWSVGDEDVFAAVACAVDDAFEYLPQLGTAV